MVSGPGSALPESLPTLLVCRGLSSHLHIQAPSQGQGSIPTGVRGGQDTEVLVPAILPTECGLLGISLLHSRPRVPHLYKGWLIFEEPFQPFRVNAHVSVLPHAQNRFKGRKCLSWNVYHKVNSNLSQGCQNNFHPGCCWVALCLPDTLRPFAAFFCFSHSRQGFFLGMCSQRRGPSCYGDL